MNFKDAVINQTVNLTTTENGMAAYKSSLDACLDFFYFVGSARGKDITPYFQKALNENAETAFRILQWARDVRGGSGERELFRQCLKFLEKNNPDLLLESNILGKIPEIGRWDDLLIFEDPYVNQTALYIYTKALREGNALAAKWAPRKGPKAIELRNFLGLTPKQYRKCVVELTKVVETQMCAREWDSINYEHVPSLAMARYTNAFNRHSSEKFNSYKESLKNGEAKINASAIYPYDVTKTLVFGDQELANEQWKALPNYMGDQKILPLVDVSGSMEVRVSNNLSAMDIAISLGLYCSDKTSGPFKDMFLTFSSTPEFVTVQGTLSEKYEQMRNSDWGYSTNIESAFQLILEVAKSNNVSQEDMPDSLLILSDMQFDMATRNYGSSANPTSLEMIKIQYEEAGYEMPGVIFWNLNSRADNVPVKFNEQGCALVSGFSPSILKTILSTDMEFLNPINIMMNTIMVDRYSVW